MAEFDQFSGDYDQRLNNSLGGLGSLDGAISSKLDLIGKLIEKNRLAPVRRVLDFGCGVGLLSQYLGQFGEQVL